MAIERISSEKGFVLNPKDLQAQVMDIIQGANIPSDYRSEVLQSAEYDISPVQSPDFSHKIQLIVLDDGTGAMRIIYKEFRDVVPRVIERGATDFINAQGQFKNIPENGQVFLGSFYATGEENEMVVHQIFVYKPGESPR